MIYINKTSEEVIIPKIVFNEPFKLICEHQIKHNIIELPVVDKASNKTYYTFNIEISEDWVDGQYDYKLLDSEDNILSEGILQFGDYTPNNKNYITSKTTKVYNG